MKEKFLKALELDKQGDWAGAHKAIQDMGHHIAYWIHAYLHRKEPDLNNASYWYFRAKREMPETSLNKEWHEIHDFIEEHYIS